MASKSIDLFELRNSIVYYLKDEDLRQALLDALRRGYVDFIELFIEYGITLEKLTIKDLEYLYTSASVCSFLKIIQSISSFLIGR